MSETNARLVERARRGEADAFEALVRRHLRVAYATAMSVVGDAQEAEDVSQDAFVTALERLDDCDPPRFTAWLLRIVRNQAISAQRRRRVRSAMPLEAAGDVASSSDPGRDEARSRLRGQLAAALDGLGETQRQVLLLHDLEGYKHREIGEMLGMPEGTVRYTLFQARRAARERLGDDHEGGTP
jgi:RNA polymerase sigma-70 factor, ECF subfamily